VDVERRGGAVRVYHRGRLVASHPELTGRHQLRVLPEHGPGAVARNARHRTSTPAPRRTGSDPFVADVQARDLSTYDALLAVGGER